MIFGIYNLFLTQVSVLDLPLQITYFADGIIGMDFLLHFEIIKFDFVNKIIEV